MAESKLKGLKISELLQLDEDKNFCLGLELVAGSGGLSKEIVSPEVNRPGLPLSGFFDHFAHKRIQIFGRGEVAYLNELVKQNNLSNINRFFDYDITVCVITHGSDIPPVISELAEAKSVAILRTHLPTEKFIALMDTMLADLFAPYEIFHGNFVSIYNIGTLIIGESGIGKSESVLGLVERGHKFIADDMAKIKRLRTPHGFELKGEANMDYGPFIEIRGIGIVNIAQYYGEGRVLKEERLGLVVRLMEWNSAYNYDRLGMDETFMDILGIEVPLKEIPVSGGRNVPLLIEVAAYREVMRRLGYNSAQELDKKIINFMKREKEVV